MPAAPPSVAAPPVPPRPPSAPGAKPADYAIPGRCMLPSGEELPCQARRVSLDRAEIVTRARVEPGETVVCYLDNVGLLRGSVEARRPDGFVLALAVSDERRGRLAARLEWHADRAREAVEQRAAPRIVPVHRAVTVRLAEDVAVPGTILNVSFSGAAIALDARVRPFVGSVIQVGKRFATVIRPLDNGVAVQFKLPFSPETFNEHVVL